MALDIIQCADTLCVIVWTCDEPYSCAPCLHQCYDTREVIDIMRSSVRQRVRERVRGPSERHMACACVGAPDRVAVQREELERTCDDDREKGALCIQNV